MNSAEAEIIQAEIIPPEEQLGETERSNALPEQIGDCK